MRLFALAGFPSVSPSPSPAERSSVMRVAPAVPAPLVSCWQRKHKSGSRVPSCRVKDGSVTELQRHSLVFFFFFCCSDKLSICLMFLTTPPPPPLPSKTQDLILKPPVGPHGDAASLVPPSILCRSYCYKQRAGLLSLSQIPSNVNIKFQRRACETGVWGPVTLAASQPPFEWKSNDHILLD